MAVVPVEQRETPAFIRLVGTAQPDRTAVVAAEVEGLIAAFLAQEGQFLKCGEVLARIDATNAGLRLEEARRTLERWEALLAELEAGTRRETIRALEAAAAEAEANLEKWKYERERILGLFDRGESNPKERHDVEMDYLASERRLAVAQAQLEQARNGPRAEEIARARADVATQSATVKRLTRDLERTQIRAPFDGFVVQKRTEVGEWIESGGAVCEMIAIDTIKVRVDVPESAVRYAQPGQNATVEIEALCRTLTAPVARLVPRGSPSARTFPVEIDLPNADHQILPGMFVWAHVPAGATTRRLMVSRDAIVARGTSKTAFVIRPGPNGGQMAIPVAVTTGIEVDGTVEIDGEGIHAGDLLVVRANERLHGPSPVLATPLTATRPAQPGE